MVTTLRSYLTLKRETKNGGIEIDFVKELIVRILWLFNEKSPYVYQLSIISSITQD